MLAAKEDIFVSRNGTVIAKLSPVSDPELEEKQVTQTDTVFEKANDYSYIGYGREASFREFLELRNNSEERYEYIDGQIYLLASPKIAHQVALAELFGIFYNFFQGKKCRPMTAPFDIELKRSNGNINMVQPDLMVICDLEEKLGEDGYYKGVPDLIVEVLSNSTKKVDMIKKLDLYMSCGVKEYWIVNPRNRVVTVYHFRDQYFYEDNTFKTNETIQSFIFADLSIGLNAIFDR